MSVHVSGKCQGDTVVDLSILICPSSYRLILADKGVIVLMKSKLQSTLFCHCFLRCAYRILILAINCKGFADCFLVSFTPSLSLSQTLKKAFLKVLREDTLFLKRINL